MKGYCLKCKKSREMKSYKKVSKGGRKYLMGLCAVCKTKMSKITK